MNWEIWVIIAILLLIIELFIPTLVALSLCVASLGAALVAYYTGPSFTWPLVTFSLIGFVFFFLIRPLAIKLWFSKAKQYRTNIDALINTVAIVTEEIDPHKDTGRVKIHGDDWRAISLHNEVIKKAEKVIVRKVDSTVLVVEPYNNKKEK